MKFTIAAGILGQRVLQTLSETSTTTTKKKYHHLDAFERFLLSSHSQTSPRRVNDGAKHPARGGLLKSKTLSDAASIRPCDPLSENPDVGILSCDPGYECIVDLSSPLGGLCSSSTSRHLQDSSCNPCGVYAAFAFDSLDNPTEIEGYLSNATCRDIYAITADTNATFSQEACIAMTSAAVIGKCCNKRCRYPLCGFRYFIDPYDTTTTVDIPVDGFANITCSALYSAAYVDATVPYEYCPDTGSYAFYMTGCCTPAPPNNCSMCGNDDLLYGDDIVYTATGLNTCANVQEYYANCNTPNYTEVCCATYGFGTPAPRPSEVPVNPTIAPVSTLPDVTSAPAPPSAGTTMLTTMGSLQVSMIMLMSLVGVTMGGTWLCH